MSHRGFFRCAYLFVLTALGILLISGCEQESPAPALIPEDPVSNVKAEENLPITLPYPKNQMTLYHFAPIFPELPAEMNDPLTVRYYGEKGYSLEVLAIEDQWVSANTSEVGKVWIPVWYGTEAAQDIIAEPPVRMTLKPDARLSLFPDSFQQRGALENSDPIYSILRWEDWYGILLPPDPWYKGNQLYRAVLLWVHESDISGLEDTNGLFAPDSTTPVDPIRHITEALLHRGMEQDIVLQILGAPHVIESSGTRNQTGEPIRLSTIWRYERPDAHFTVTISEEGLLEEWNWILPMTDYGQARIGSYQHPSQYSYEFRGISPPFSIEMDWEWRNEGTFGYTYLMSATDDVLMLKGDDGGYSGMHYDSSLYAISRHTGETIWKVDAGFGGIWSFMDTGKEHVTVFTPYNPDQKEYLWQARHIRISDGKVLWNYEQPGAREFIAMARAKGTVLLYSQSSEKEAGKLSVLDIRTGELKWHKTFEEPYQILNRSAEDPYILLQHQDTLQALHPKTGKPQWRLKADQPLDEERMRFADYFFEPYVNPFDPDHSKRWIRLGMERLQIDVKSGLVNARCPIQLNEAVQAIDDRYLLIQKPLGDMEFWKASLFKTGFYDTKTGMTLWTLPGMAHGAVIKGERVFMIVDGLPTAINKKTGEVEWQVQTSGFGSNMNNYLFGRFTLLKERLLLPYGKDLLIIDKQEGLVLHRIQNVLFGYPDLRETETLNGLINRDGEAVYIGSANGYFSKLKLDQGEIR
ncbi:PQQ-binding-like beta-propeller repeat protein [Paenibacillus tarimensis]